MGSQSGIALDKHQSYFDEQAGDSNPEFWRRFGRHPDFAGKRVLDLGCGHGALSLEIAKQGGYVTGVDLAEDLIEWAQTHVADQPVAGSLRFEVADVCTLDDQFDLVVSKDTFEHIDDLETVLTALHRMLAPGGELWAGFSPLYYSPYGDHTRTGMRLPWAHALPWPLVRRVATRYRQQTVNTLSDVGLNGMTPAQFRNYAAAAGFDIKSINYNPGDKRLLPVLSRLRRVHVLERYATVSIYAVLGPNGVN